MEVVASTAPKSPAKRVRTPAVKAAPAAVPVVKQKVAPRKPKMSKAPMPAPELLDAMISTAAYYRAASRGFAPGHELQDWLEAERLIRAQYA